ncbi:MAG: hypothetical protein JSV50_06655 [Desulfobacteraceae bacterium]|nr:MAG: hypothetical protein JSV50_06655 [Desulfobacteraceae bacterium]
MQRHNITFTPSPYPSPQEEGTRGNPATSGRGIENIINNLLLLYLRHILCQMRIFIGDTEITLNCIWLPEKNYPGEYFTLLIGWHDERAKPALLWTEINFNQPLTYCHANLERSILAICLIDH